MTQPNEVLLVLTNVPAREVADNIARTLIEEKLAACVNILSACTSVYRWQGAIESAEEIPLWIKTTGAQYACVQALIRRLHPYELPEIIAVPIERGFPAYLDWIAAESGVPHA